MDNHWIVPNDWVIRVSQPEKYDDGCGDGVLGGGRHRESEFPPHAFTDHAVYVRGITNSHLTIYDPVFNSPMLLQLSSLGGEWRLATEQEVLATWDLAITRRDRSQLSNFENEKKQYPYRKKSHPEGMCLKSPVEIACPICDKRLDMLTPAIAQCLGCGAEYMVRVSSTKNQTKITLAVSKPPGR